MYIPKAFVIDDSAVLETFMASNSFATLISTVNGVPFATHVPLILDRGEASPHGVLLGHLARANPHWRAFASPHESLAIFHGPHAYISPSWYATAPAVPTWNYAVVHAYGVPQLMDDPAWVAQLVDRLVAVYEAGLPQPWPGVLPTEFKTKLVQAIVGFAMPITRMEGKFKLGQNRPVADQQGVIHQLAASDDPIARALGELSNTQLKKKGI